MTVPPRIPEANLLRVVDRASILSAAGLLACCAAYVYARSSLPASLPADASIIALMAAATFAGFILVSAPEAIRRRRVAVMCAVLAANEEVFPKGRPALKPDELRLVARRWISAGFTPPRALDALRRGAIDPIGTYAEDRWFWREVSRKYRSLPLHTSQ